MVTIYGILRTLIALIAFSLFFNNAYSQNNETHEVGRELTKKFADAFDLNTPNSIPIKGRDAWVIFLPKEFDVKTFEKKVNDIVGDLDGAISPAWTNEKNVLAMGFDYKTFLFGIAYDKGNNMLFSFIQKSVDHSTQESNETQNNLSDERPQWETIASFNGSGPKKTAPFTVNSNEWKIVYNSKSSLSLGGAGHILQLYLLKPGQELYEGEIVANEVNKVSIKGESFVYKSGRFYIESNSANGDWEIMIMAPKN